MRRYKDNNDYPIERIPLDGSMRMMEKTDYVTREFNYAKGVYFPIRIVYRHKPTGKLSYKLDNRWFGTYTDYCRNTKTNEKGCYY